MTFVLAFDTATEACAVALGDWPEPGAAEGAPVVIAARDSRAPRAALSQLLPAVYGLLEDGGVGMWDIGLVAVGRGPGSYTGVRIGMAAAKGLAHGLGVPLLGVGTLDAVAWCFADHEGLLGVVGDAMRQEVYPVLFECAGGDVRRLTEDAVAAPDDVAREWADRGEDILLAGDGLAKYADVFGEALGAHARFADESVWRPTGEGLLAAAWAAGARSASDPATVLPLYTRLSDAEHLEPGRSADVPGSGVAGPVDWPGERGGG